jgi:hypothetical protein
MGGIVGRLFREFAITLSVAILVSMVISLTAAPMMCAYLLKPQESHGRLYEISENAFNWIIRMYGRSLAIVLRHSFITLLVLLGTIGVTGYLFVRVPKGFFPQQDTGRPVGQIVADQDSSFQTVDRILRQTVDTIGADPAVSTSAGLTGGGGITNNARLFASLKPLGQRKINADALIARLRPKLARIPGASVYLQSIQDMREGGRSTAAQYQFTLSGDNLQDLLTYAPRMFRRVRSIPIIADVNSDQQDKGMQASILSFLRFGCSQPAQSGFHPSQRLPRSPYQSLHGCRRPGWRASRRGRGPSELKPSGRRPRAVSLWQHSGITRYGSDGEHESGMPAESPEQKQGCSAENPPTPGTDSAALQQYCRAHDQSGHRRIHPREKPLNTRIAARALILPAHQPHEAHRRSQQSRRCNQSAGHSGNVIPGEGRKHGDGTRSQVADGDTIQKLPRA